MLPFCDRIVNVPRKDISPVWTRSFPAPKQPQTIGQHLRKKRFELGIRQAEAARQLRVSKRTLGLWECDRTYPTWSFQPRVIAYLGYDPFTDPALGRPKGNEASGVAFLSSGVPLSLGQHIAKRRMELKKTRKKCAEELGVSVKTLWSWETNRHQPSTVLRERIVGFLGFDPGVFNPVVRHCIARRRAPAEADTSSLPVLPEVAGIEADNAPFGAEPSSRLMAHDVLNTSSGCPKQSAR